MSAAPSGGSSTPPVSIPRVDATRATAQLRLSTSSDAGVPIEKIAGLVGHNATTTTEAVYRKQIRPVVVGGAEVMDRLFSRPEAPDA
jgi:hypothetical protein